MAFDLGLLAEKLRKYRDQFELSLSELSQATGIEQQSLAAFEAGQKAPTGDEILILADIYKCDYRFFISNERLAPFEQTETLFRRYGKEFSRNDRWAVQEILFLAECEHFMFANLGLFQDTPFTFRKEGDWGVQKQPMKGNFVAQDLDLTLSPPPTEGFIPVHHA